jgi:molybdopterin converting factor small subunit
VREGRGDAVKVTVVIPGPLLDVARGKSRVEVEVEQNTVLGAFEALRGALPGVYDRFMTEQRELRPHINVFVGVEDTRWTGGLETPLREGCEIYVLPAVSGGKPELFPS